MMEKTESIRFLLSARSSWPSLNATGGGRAGVGQVFLNPFHLAPHHPGHRRGEMNSPTYRSLAQIVLLGQLSHLPLIWPEQPPHRDHHGLEQFLLL